MNNNGKVNFAENSIYSLILVTKQLKIKIFQFQRFYNFLSMKYNGNSDFPENSINSMKLSIY